MEGLKLEQNLKAAFQLRRMPSPELKKQRHTLPLSSKDPACFCELSSVITQTISLLKKTNLSLSLPKALSYVSLHLKGKA